MADDADRLNDMDARLQEIAAKQRLIFKSKSATHCVECGKKIPEARRKAIKTDYCIDCQVKNERRMESK